MSKKKKKYDYFQIRKHRQKLKNKRIKNYLDKKRKENEELSNNSNNEEE